MLNWLMELHPDFTLTKVSAKALLFLIVAQILCDLIHKSSFKRITLNEREIKISQLADDTTLFLKNESQIGVALNVVIKPVF